MIRIIVKVLSKPNMNHYIIFTVKISPPQALDLPYSGGLQTVEGPNAGNQWPTMLPNFLVKGCDRMPVALLKNATPHSVCGLAICGAPGNSFCTLSTNGLATFSYCESACGILEGDLAISPARTYAPTIAAPVPC